MKKEVIESLLKTESRLQFIRILFNNGYGECCADKSKLPKVLQDKYKELTAPFGDFNCPIDKFR